MSTDISTGVGPSTWSFFRRLTRRRVVVLAIAVVLGGLSIVMARAWYPKRLAEVIPQRLYRCGQPTPRQLDHVWKRYPFRTILSLCDPNTPEAVDEQHWAEAHQVRWLCIPLPGNGATTPEQRSQITGHLLNEKHAPVLVHCAAGANRTGVACALARIHGQGWTAEQALTEMASYGFDDDARHAHVRHALSEEARLRRAKSRSQLR